MTVEILNKYRTNTDWCSLINKLDGQLFALKKVESDLIESADYDCPVCAGPTKREDTVCPFCRSKLPERGEKGTWRKVAPSQQLLDLVRDAWDTYSEIFRIQQAIDLESDAVSETEKVRKSAAQLRQDKIEFMLETAPEDVMISAANYDTFVADYLLGVVEERYNIPFVAKYRSKLPPVSVEEVMEQIRKFKEDGII